MGVYRYFLIESGEHLERAKAIQAEYYAATKIASEFAEKYGTKSFFTNGGGFINDGLPVKVCGLARVNPLPKGWRNAGNSRFPSMKPRKDAADLWAEIDALPGIPNLRAEADCMVGWDGNLTSQDEDGTRRSQGLPSCQLIWTEQTFCICVPMHDIFGGASPKVVEKAAAVPVPDGMREITEAEWTLIDAQLKVEREKAKAAGLPEAASAS